MTVLLTSDAVRTFWDEGYLAIPEICTVQELEWLREVYDRLFAQRVGWQKGHFFDFAGPDTPGSAPVLPQLLEPTLYDASLKKAKFRANALAIAKQLLGPSARLVFEHAVMKPARIGAETPWHQDEAFFPIYTDHQSITIWMPLQPVDASNGCMEFVARSHKGPVLPHRRLNNDPRLHGLEAYNADVHQSVACPLPAGAATVHHCRTLHHAGPNLTDGPRRAYALGFGVRSKEFTIRTEFPWNAVRTSARDMRADRSQGVVERVMSQLRKTAKRVLR